SSGDRRGIPCDARAMAVDAPRLRRASGGDLLWQEHDHLRAVSRIAARGLAVNREAGRPKPPGLQDRAKRPGFPPQRWSGSAPRAASAPDYRDGAVVEGVVVSTGTALEGVPGRDGVVTEAPGTPGIATLVPTALAAPGTVVAVPGTAAAVPGTPETFPVMSLRL